MFHKFILFLILAIFAYGDNLKELINYTNDHNKLLLSKKLSTKAKIQELKSTQSSSMPTIDIGGF